MRKDTKDALLLLVQTLTDRGGIKDAGTGMTNMEVSFGNSLWSGMEVKPAGMSNGLADLNRMLVAQTMEELGLATEDGEPVEGTPAGGVDFINLVPLTELFQTAMYEPLQRLRNDILCPQGIHQTWYGISLLVGGKSPAFTSGDLDEELDKIIARYQERLAAANEALKTDAEGFYSVDIWGDVLKAIKENQAAMETDAMIAARLTSMGSGGCAFSNSFMQGMLFKLSGGKELVQPFINAIAENPTKANPTFAYFPQISIHNQYSRVESTLAGICNTLIPPLEWSRCVPYLNIQINTKRSLFAKAKQDVPNGVVDSMSLFKFFHGALPNLRGVDDLDISGTDIFNPFPPDIESLIEQAGENEPFEFEYKTSVGMEAFTLPQAIVPAAQPNNAFLNRDGNASVDKMRPFMTIESFNSQVSPTTGAGSTQRANLALILHDRARLPQIAALIKPATLNQVEFEIEWGWSHPIDDDTNVYGKYINSLRQKQTYTLYQSSYSFDESGQVKITLGLVTSGVDSVREIDASTTGLVVPGFQTVEKAYEALQIAKDSAADILGSGAIADLSATQTINTLTLNSAGTLISSDFQKRIEEWMEKAKKTVQRGGQPAQSLGDVIKAVEDLRSSLNSAQATLMADLDKKMKCINSNSYSNWTSYVMTNAHYDPSGEPEAAQFYNLDNPALPSRWHTKTGEYIPLGALIHLFVVLPLMTTGMYDEVQLVSYPANLEAGAAAGANVGAIPVAVGKIAGGKSWGDLVKDQYKQFGGQYPVVRMLEWISDNFVKPQMSVAYGLSAKTPKGQSVSGNSALKYNKDTGALEANYESGGELMDQTATRLRKIYYGDSAMATPDSPRPTSFRPIDLQCTFEVAHANRAELIRQGVPAASVPEDYDEKTVLRIHLYDGGSVDTQSYVDLLKQSRTSVGGILIPPPRKIAHGCPEATRIISGWNDSINDAQKACEVLTDLGVLKPTSVETQPVDPEQKKRLEERINKHKEQYQFLTDLGQLDQAAGVLKLINKDESRLAEGDTISSGKYMLNGGLSGAKALVRFVSAMAPNIMYGEEGSQTNSITIKQRTNSKGSSVYMRRALENSKGGNSSDEERGLPMRAAPADISIKAFGNPSYKFMQKFFINAHTGTTIDNLYGISGIEHSLTPDDFVTDLKMVPLESYGVFQNLTANAIEAETAMKAIQTKYNAHLAELARQEKARQAAAAAAAAERERIANLDEQTREALSSFNEEVAIFYTHYKKFNWWRECGAKNRDWWYSKIMFSTGWHPSLVFQHPARHWPNFLIDAYRAKWLEIFNLSKRTYFRDSLGTSKPIHTWMQASMQLGWGPRYDVEYMDSQGYGSSGWWPWHGGIREYNHNRIMAGGGAGGSWWNDDWAGPNHNPNIWWRGVSVKGYQNCRSWSRNYPTTSGNYIVLMTKSLARCAAAIETANAKLLEAGKPTTSVQAEFNKSNIMNNVQLNQIHDFVSYPGQIATWPSGVPTS